MMALVGFEVCAGSVSIRILDVTMRILKSSRRVSLPILGGFLAKRRVLLRAQCLVQWQDR